MSGHPDVSRSSSSSQSLFQVYYLGCTRVDRRCSSVVMPWIIEELKLKTQEMKFLWLTPGPDTVTFVADNGQEVLSHMYTSILQCCIAVDGISFAYISRSTNDNKYYCHVFQALTFEEAESIMKKFKQHAREEVIVGSTISHGRASDLPTESSGFIFPSHKHHPADSSISTRANVGSEFNVQFLGKFEVPPPATATDTQAQTIDKIVTRLKDTYLNDKRTVKSKKGLGTRLREKIASTKYGSHLVAGTDNIDSPSLSQEEDEVQRTDSSPSLHSQGSGSDVSVRVTTASPDLPVFSAADEGTDEPSSSNRRDSEQSISTQLDLSGDHLDFDTIPELPSLQGSAVFQSLSDPHTMPCKKVRLVFSGMNVCLKSEDNSERLLKKSIRNIACCGQGQKESEYFAFTSSSQKDSEKKYHCHIFKGENKQEIEQILSCFKAAYVHALSFGMPAALCDTCPLQQLHLLCKNLQGVSTQVAQSIIQVNLQSIGETDYNQIMKQYKLSEHADHEYTQIIVLVGLIRQYFQSQQELHTHPGTGGLPLTTSSSTLRLPALRRAKNAITSSFENLKNKPRDRSSRFFKGKSLDKSEEAVTQSLNTRPLSPLFAKKGDLETLMAPIPTTPVKSSSSEDVRRERTWSGFVKRSHTGSPSPQLAPSQEVKKTTTEQKDTPKSIDRDSMKTPDSEKQIAPSPEPRFKAPITPVRKVKSQRPLRPARQSLTPPAVSSSKPSFDGKNKRTHRRAASVVTSQWRHEMFASCNTPDRRSTATDFLEDFEIIDLDIKRGSWILRSAKEESPRTRAKKRWKNAIEQQIILNRMEKENTLFMKASGDAELKRFKLSYSTPKLDNPELVQKWNSVLSQSQTLSQTEISEMVIKGVPPCKRAEVWPMLAARYCSRTDSDWTLPTNQEEKDGLRHLLSMDTEFEHNIVVDLGRTFPNHPYFSRPMEGQVSLRNVLHCYAVADTETGYCQGLSFVTGIIIMHSKDDQAAFELLYQLMTLYNYREIYFENLTNLQMRLYQLSRLLHDYNPVLYQHLRLNDITPFFYAAPWFLTIFASQFPIAFTARVFDLIFCEGTDVILKVILAMLQVHEESILQCKRMEPTCKYLKTTLPQLALESIDKIFETASKFKFGDRLSTFEAEYNVMAELDSSFRYDVVIDDFPSVAEVLKRQNIALIEQLAICHARNTKLESMIEGLQTQFTAQTQRISELESKVLSLESSKHLSSLDSLDLSDTATS